MYRCCCHAILLVFDLMFVCTQNLLSKAVSIQDCYRWMDLVGGPRRVPDKDALVDLFAIVRVPRRDYIIFMYMFII